MKCTCGDIVSMEAANRDEAVKKMQDMMSEEAIAKHFEEKHPGQTPIAKAESDMMIAQHMQEGDLRQQSAVSAAS